MMQTCGRRRHLERQPKLLWAYINDPMPTDGPRRLLDQRRTAERTAAGAGRRIDRYVVDSGSALTGEGRGANLQAMIDEMRTAERRVTLVIAAAGHLATTERAIRKALADLLAAGFVLKDASGELHPDAATVALAAAAIRPTSRRAPQYDLERNDV